MNGTQPYTYECVCGTDTYTTVLSVLGVVVPLIISEILSLSDCEANGIIDGIIKLRKLLRDRDNAPK